MLAVTTFEAARGGSALYKALTHPLVAEAMQALQGSFDRFGSHPIMHGKLHDDVPSLWGKLRGHSITLVHQGRDGR